MAEGIEILISLEDKLSGPIKNIIKNLENLKSIKDSLIGNFEKFTSSLNKTVGSFDQMKKQSSNITSGFDSINDSFDKVDGSIAIMEESIKGTEKIYEDFSDATDNSWKAIMKFDEEISATVKTMAEVEKQGKRFKMQWLGVGFLGMQLSRTFGVLNKTIMDTYFAGELMNIQLTMIWSAAPYLEPLVDIFYSLADIFYALPESVQGFMGVLFPLISTFGSILSQIGFMAIGIQSLSMVLGAMGITSGSVLISMGNLLTFLIAFSVPILILIGILALLWLAWQTNFANIRDFVAKIWESIKSIFQGAWEVISGIMDIIVGIVTLDWEKIKTGVGKIITGLWRILVDGFGRMVVAAVEFGINILKAFWEWLTKLPGFIWEGLVGAYNFFTKFFGDVIRGASNFASNFINAILNGIRSLASQVADVLWNLIPEPFKGWIRGAAGFVGGVAKGIAGFVGGMFPSYQAGGRVRETGIALVHKGETVVPAGETLNFAPVINISANLSGSADINSLGKQLMNVMYDELRRRRI